MEIQALIPSALAALHNFIRQYDPSEIQMYDEDVPLDFQMDPRPESESESVGELGTGRVSSGETTRANKRRDEIAHAMWEQYQAYLESRAACRQ